MASYDNLMTMEQPWQFRPTFADAWISDVFTKETDSLTKALQKSFAATSSDGDAFSAEMVEPLYAKPEITPLQTPTASGGSENEASLSRQQQRRSVPPSGRVTKRKSRASKRSTTTFITADPANFRQMVQQVTGARISGFNGPLQVAPVLKPEPQRVVSRRQPGSGLPTLDSSAFLLNGSASSLMSQPAPPPSTVAENGGANSTGLDFDSFCSFPTLESWKVM